MNERYASGERRKKEVGGGTSETGRGRQQAWDSWLAGPVCCLPGHGLFLGQGLLFVASNQFAMPEMISLSKDSTAFSSPLSPPTACTALYLLFLVPSFSL